MADKPTVAVSDDFLDSFAALPKHTQSKVTEFLEKFRNNPNAPGIHKERLKNGKDIKMCSVRIDQTYRAILVQEGNVFLLLWVDHHDDAYDWAKNKKCEVNAENGVIQVYEMVVVQQPTVPASPSIAPLLFAEFTDKDLLGLGVPPEQLPFVRSLQDSNEFMASQSMIPADAYENLAWYAVHGMPLGEVKELAADEARKRTAKHDLASALQLPETLKSFVVIDGEDELRRIMAEPLEKWRVFLHPAQRDLAEKNYSGAARVLGSAGTGKTVVAMHRAKHLVSALKDGERILFTTFTANLATDIRNNLRKICSAEELKRIDVINLDAWVARFLQNRGYSATIMYDDAVKKLWEKAIAICDVDDDFPVSFYQSEYDRVVMAREAFSLEKYVKAPRTGRGTRLDRKKRIQIWKVFEAFQDMMKAQQIRDINTAMHECCVLLSKADPADLYKYVIVDEGQDLSADGLRLIRALAGDEHPNDIFIVGDAHQRIYKNKASLSSCGINVRGRSSILKINYRTTEETRRAAFALLQGLSFDDLDSGVDAGDQCQSLTHGDEPKVVSYADINSEVAGVAADIQHLLDAGVKDKDICIVARTHKLLDDYVEKFAARGLACHEIRKSKADDQIQPGIRVATMHRVKGLEFQYVFVVGANNSKIPLNSAIDHTDPVSERESITAEKCLLYVALTRAQKGAYVSGYGKMSEFLTTKLPQADKKSGS